MYVCLSYTVIDELSRKWKHQPPFLPSKQSKEDSFKCIEENRIPGDNHVPSWVGQNTG